jgi:hypothetical protein
VRWRVEHDDDEDHDEDHDDENSAFFRCGHRPRSKFHQDEAFARRSSCNERACGPLLASYRSNALLSHGLQRPRSHCCSSFILPYLTFHAGRAGEATPRATSAEPDEASRTERGTVRKPMGILLGRAEREMELSREATWAGGWDISIQDRLTMYGYIELNGGALRGPRSLHGE